MKSMNPPLMPPQIILPIKPLPLPPLTSLYMTKEKLRSLVNSVMMSFDIFEGLKASVADGATGWVGVGLLVAAGMD
jgi:hypothetical protein